MTISFDAEKRAQTLAARGLDMADASGVFDGDTLTISDNRHDYGEARFITVGFLDRRMVVVVWTPRNGIRRIISMRKANDREKVIYGPRFDREGVD